MCNFHRFLYRRYAKFLTCEIMHSFKPILNICIKIFYVNFNRLKTVNMELKNLCFQELIVMQTANQALCSLNRMSTDKTVLGKNCYHYIHFLHNHHRF